MVQVEIKLNIVDGRLTVEALAVDGEGDISISSQRALAL